MIHFPPSRQLWLVSAALAAVLAAGGCVDPRDAEIAKLRSAEKMLLAENKGLGERNARLQTDQDRLTRENATLLGLGPKRLEYLFRVDKIDIGGYSAGVNLSGKGEGHDAVRIYLVPLDKDGNAIKAAGAVRIQVFDLAAGPEFLVCSCDFPVETIGKYWLGQFLSYYYKFECKFAAPPQHPNLTVRVTFTDYLTGREFETQKVFTVRLAPTSQPATASAPAR